MRILGIVLAGIGAFLLAVQGMQTVAHLLDAGGPVSVPFFFAGLILGIGGLLVHNTAR